jgi:hypothetical protein
MAQQDITQVKALTFDVFDTVVDWRGSLIREGLAFGVARGIQIGRVLRTIGVGAIVRDEPWTPWRVTVDEH